MSPNYFGQHALMERENALDEQTYSPSVSAMDPVCRFRIVVKPFEENELQSSETEYAKAVPADDVSPQINPNTLYCHAVKRGLDLFFASMLLFAMVPVFAMLSVISVFKHKGQVFERTLKLGRNCAPFYEYSFVAKKSRWSYLPLLLNILKGDLSFVGPRAGGVDEFCPECCASLRKTPPNGIWFRAAKTVRTARYGQQPTAREADARLRNQVRPGIISEYWVMQKANQAYDAETRIDAEYVRNLSFRTDVSLLLRALPATLCHFIFGPEDEARRHISDRIQLLDIAIDNITMKDAIDRIMALAGQARPRQVCFVNPQYANVAYGDAQYKAALKKADLVLADGIGMKIAGKMLRREIRENVNGTDLFPRLCEALSQDARSLYLLGAAPGVVDSVRAWVEKNHPGVEVKGCHHGYFSPEDEGRIIQDIAASRADILLVAMGVPYQELWIERHLPELGVKVAMGVGGLFDFYSGRIRRAPLWVREIGMEWFYRFMQEPSRLWKRYLIGNNLFLFRVLLCRMREKNQSLQPVAVSRQ